MVLIYVSVFSFLSLTSAGKTNERKVTELLLLPSRLRLRLVYPHASDRRLAQGNELVTFWGLLTVASLLMLLRYDGRFNGKVERCASGYCFICL
jgi:hypothetical protein